MSCKANIVGVAVGAGVRLLAVLQNGEKIFFEIFYGGGAAERREAKRARISVARRIGQAQLLAKKSPTQPFTKPLNSSLVYAKPTKFHR